MAKFLVDEDMPRATTVMLRERGFEAMDVRDCGLRGKSDQEIFSFALREKAIIVTADLGFGNLLYYPVGKNPGIVLVRFPNEISTSELNRQLSSVLDEISENELEASLVIVEPGKLRIRRR